MSSGVESPRWRVRVASGERKRAKRERLGTRELLLAVGLLDSQSVFGLHPGQGSCSKEQICEPSMAMVKYPSNRNGSGSRLMAADRQTIEIMKMIVYFILSL